MEVLFYRGLCIVKLSIREEVAQSEGEEKKGGILRGVVYHITAAILRED